MFTTAVLNLLLDFQICFNLWNFNYRYLYQVLLIQCLYTKRFSIFTAQFKAKIVCCIEKKKFPLKIIRKLQIICRTTNSFYSMSLSVLANWPW